MRKLLHGLFGLCRCLVLVTIGAGALGFALAGPHCHGADCWIWLLDMLRPYADIAMVAGAGLLLLEFLYLLTRPRGDDEDRIDFKGKGGSISFRLQTIADLLARIQDTSDDILSLEPALFRRKKSVDVELAVRVKDSANVPDLCRALQDQVRRTLAGHVGPLTVREVRVRVEELVPRHETVPGAEASADSNRGGNGK